MNRDRQEPSSSVLAHSYGETVLSARSFIGGNWCAAENGKTFDVLNPATGDVIATCPDMGAIETQHAIECAQVGWTIWRTKTAKERSAILRKFYDLIVSNQEKLATIITLECGKPISEARGEVLYGAAFIEWFAEEAKRTYGDVIPSPFDDRRIITTKQPIGVCGLITPWNFPVAMITRKLGPALAAGCSVVLKPAEATPLSAIALIELGIEAGIPSDVFNLVTAAQGASVGDEMCRNSLVRKISFTGSTAVGKTLLKQSANTVKKLSLELGGNAPFIVFEDADLEAAVEGAMASKYRNTGQTCVCANRFYVQSSVYEEFAEKLKERVLSLTVGNGISEQTTQGPLINAAGLAKVEEHVRDALKKGARAICGGTPHDLGGNFYEPTILLDVNSEMKLAKEETFGPVSPLFRFDAESDAIRLANDTEFGLASYIYTRDVGRCWRVAEALEYGIVGINEGIISTEVAPFGGIKESGLGREGSKYGIEDYLEVKYMCLGGLQ